MGEIPDPVGWISKNPYHLPASLRLFFVTQVFKPLRKHNRTSHQTTSSHLTHLSPPPGISVRLFSLKSCSKSQTDLTAGSNINLAKEPKIWRKLLHEENQRFRGYFFFFVFKPLKRWDHSRNVWFSQPFSTRMLTKLWLTKAYLSSMAMILSLLFSDWKPWQTFQWESSSKNC